METKVLQESRELNEQEKRELAIATQASAVGMATSLFKKRITIREERDFFLERYGDLLATSAHVYVQGQMLSADSVFAFDESFFFVLRHSYSFFDAYGNLIEDKKYVEIMERIKKNNPEWKERFEIHHQMELDRIIRVRKGKPFRPSQ